MDLVIFKTHKTLKENLLKKLQATRIGIPDVFSPSGPREKIRFLYNLDPNGVVKVCRGLVKPA